MVYRVIAEIEKTVYLRFILKGYLMVMVVLGRKNIYLFFYEAVF